MAGHLVDGVTLGMDHFWLGFTCVIAFGVFRKELTMIGVAYRRTVPTNTDHASRRNHNGPYLVTIAHGLSSGIVSHVPIDLMVFGSVGINHLASRMAQSLNCS